jgi:hypothetical protein
MSRSPNQALRGSSQCLTPAAWELTALAVLCSFYLFVESDETSVVFAAANYFGPIALAVILVGGAVRSVTLNHYAIWTGLLWFRISTAIYFGIGSMIYHHMNDYSTRQMWAFYYPHPGLILKANLFMAASALFLLLAPALMGRIMLQKRVISFRDGPRNDDQRLLLICATAFCAAGYATRYFVNIPQVLGLYGDTTILGMLGAVEHAAPAGLFLLTMWCLRFNRNMLVAPLGLLALDITMSLIVFNKSNAMLPTLVVSLAFLTHQLTLYRLIACIAVLVGLFQFIEPIVGFGRTSLGEGFGTIRAATLSQRWSILELYFSSGGKDGWNREEAQFQGSLVRISYLNAVTPAINLFDNGQSGNTLADVFTILIPRAIWPGKPVYDHGGRFNETINGSNTSSSWMGYAAEAYWNIGWSSLPLIMFPLGLVFFYFGRYALYILDNRLWLHFPTVFLGMFLGVRTDGSLVTEVFATCVIALIYHGMATFGTSFLRSRDTKLPSQHSRSAAPRRPQPGERQS